jgi:hypothetical protein
MIKRTLEQRIARLERLLKNEASSTKKFESFESDLDEDGARAAADRLAKQFANMVGVRLIPNLKDKDTIDSPMFGVLNPNKPSTADEVAEDPDARFTFEYDVVGYPADGVKVRPTDRTICVWRSIMDGYNGEGAVDPKTGICAWVDWLEDGSYPLSAWKNFSFDMIHGEDWDDEEDEEYESVKRLLKNEAESVNGAKIIFKNKLWDVYRVTSYDAAKQLGRGTDWGITGKWDSDSYQTNGVWNGKEFYDKLVKKLDGGFYFYIKKSGGVKYCIGRRPNGTISLIEDNDCNTIKPKDILLVEPEFPSIDGVFVPKIPNKKVQTATALVNAIAEGKVSEVASLLAQGANPNEPDKSERYPAYPLAVAIFNKQYEIAKMLLDAGADPNDPAAGKRAMSAAVGELKINKDSKYVDLLVEYGSTQPQVW